MIRVLHVAKGLGLGGTEKVMQLFAAHLDRSVFEVAVFSFGDGERRRLLTEQGIKVFVGPDLLGVLQDFGPDIAHVHRAGWPEPELLRSFKLAGTPVVVETNVFGRFDPSPSAGVLDATLFVSRFCLERFRAVHKADAGPPRYDFLYNPVDTDAFARLCPPDRERPALVVGRLSRPDPGKWSALAWEMLPLVAREFPEARYRVVGMIPEAREFFRSRGLEAMVEECGPFVGDDELGGFLGGINLLAHANDTGESFGLAIAEAMAAGLPVVTHPCEGLKDNAQLELVRDGETGFVAASVEDYAACVVKLLRDPDLARRMGEAGRARAVDLFNARSQAERLGRIYLDLLQAKGGGK